MSMTDPIADLLTRIRNAIQARKETVLVPRSRQKLEILRLMKAEGFIKEFQEQNDGTTDVISIILKYDSANQGVIRGIERISRPSRRVYVGRDEIPFVRNGLGIAILTTPRGVLTDHEARQAGVGGEVICYVW
jgi:small subunit ribosomal protein S8